MKSKSLSWQTESALEQAYQALITGSIVLCSTDTVLGLLVSATQKGHDKLDKVKGRQEKPYLVLFESKSSLIPFIEPVSFHIENFMERCWPGPVTLIVKARNTIATYMKSSDNTIAVRVPNHENLQRLLHRTGPLFSTSANKAKLPVPERVEEVDPIIRDQCALIITDKHPQTSASTILDCTHERIRVIREGAFAIKELEVLYGQSFD